MAVQGTKVIVWGFGSIGERHARILVELACNVAVISGRAVDWPVHYSSVEMGIEEFQPSIVVIATETAHHRKALSQLKACGFQGNVLIEKPITSQYEPHDAAVFDGHNIFCAYNLRFHPICQRLRELLIGKKVISAQWMVGQYLPTWRANVDYRQSYSAHASRGGGVLRDLSHELDYVTWLLGRWIDVDARGGHFSHLEISSDDAYSLLMSTEKCPAVAVHMNYLDRPARRNGVITLDDGTLFIDWINGSLQYGSETEHFSCDRDHSYREMHRALLSGDLHGLCAGREAFEISGLIHAAEQSVQNAQRIKRA